MANKQIRIPFRSDRLKALLDNYTIRYDTAKTSINIKRIPDSPDTPANELHTKENGWMRDIGMEMSDMGDGWVSKYEFTNRWYYFTYHGKEYTGNLHGKISIRFLAKATSYNEASIRKCLSDNLITVDELERISEFLDVSPDYLKGVNDIDMSSLYSYSSGEVIDMNDFESVDDVISYLDSIYKVEKYKAEYRNRIDHDGILIAEYDGYHTLDNEMKSFLLHLIQVMLKEDDGITEETAQSIEKNINNFSSDVLDSIFDLIESEQGKKHNYVFASDLMAKEGKGNGNG